MPDPANSRPEAVRKACLAAALAAYEDAAIRGLCQAGAWEAAVGAIRSLDLAALDVPEVPLTASVAAARTGTLATVLLESAAARSLHAAEDFRARARAIASRAATLRSTLGGAGEALEVAERCAHVATLAAEVARDGHEAGRSDATVALRLTASAADCALALAEADLAAAPETDRTRAAERRIWRTRLLLRRARPLCEK